MEEFKNYMDRVRVDDETKNKTTRFVTQSLLQAEPKKERHASGAKSKIKRRAAALAAMAACLVVGIAGWAYYETPVEYISLDINPSVELGVNAFKKVVRAQGVNQDGVELIGNLDLHNMSAEQAVRVLVSTACEQGYIAKDGSTVIALTAQAASLPQAQMLGVQSEEGAQTALQENNALALVYGDTADIAIRTQAQEMGVSPGKYKLMLALQAMDPSLDLETLKTATVSQIMLKAVKMEGDADEAGDLAATIQNMRQTALHISRQSGEGQSEDISLNEQVKTQQKTQEQLQENLSEQQQDQQQTQQQTQTQDLTQASCEPTGYVEQNRNAGEEAGREQEQNEPEEEASPSASAGPKNQSETKQEEPSGGQGPGGSGKSSQ